jgi:hypothetical protein
MNTLLLQKVHDIKITAFWDVIQVFTKVQEDSAAAMFRI